MTVPESISIFLSSFSLVAFAEIGDKTQLVCMTLAARHRHWPVVLGASVAFVLLNTLAVLFGAGVAAWLPEKVTAGAVSVLFAAFGIHTLLSHSDKGLQHVEEKTYHGIFFTTFLLIFVAEFGDKTQIAVAGLASSFPALPVWLGATGALIFVSGIGVWAGRTILQRLPLIWVHRLSGILFLIFAVLAAWQVIN